MPRKPPIVQIRDFRVRDQSPAGRKHPLQSNRNPESNGTVSHNQVVVKLEVSGAKACRSLNSTIDNPSGFLDGRISAILIHTDHFTRRDDPLVRAAIAAWPPIPNSTWLPAAHTIALNQYLRPVESWYSAS
jgi:hypothetical protein